MPRWRSMQRGPSRLSTGLYPFCRDTVCVMLGFVNEPILTLLVEAEAQLFFFCEKAEAQLNLCPLILMSTDRRREPMRDALTDDVRHGRLRPGSHSRRSLPVGT